MWVALTLALLGLAHGAENRDETNLLAPRAHRVVRHHHHHHVRHHGRHGRQAGGGAGGDKLEASPAPKPYCVDKTDISGKASDSGFWHNPWGWKCIDYERKQHCTGKQFESNLGGSIGELKANAKYTGGEKMNYPEAHCCICGGGIQPISTDDGDSDEPETSDPPDDTTPPGGPGAGPAAKKDEPATSDPPDDTTPPGGPGAGPAAKKDEPAPKKCKNNAEWKNSYGLTCDDYKSKGYCNGIGFAKGMEWTGGKDYQFPEKNCCHCQA